MSISDENKMYEEELKIAEMVNVSPGNDYLGKY